MKEEKTRITILIADDDEDDKMLIREALAESQLPLDLYFVSNGEELLDYLYNCSQYTNRSQNPRPGLILLDLNMPKKDGLEVLKDIKTDPSWRSIPVIVLTTSASEEDIYQTYDLGANSLIVKPVTYASLVEVMQNIGKYWFEIVQLPLEAVEQSNEQKSNPSSFS